MRKKEAQESFYVIGFSFGSTPALLRIVKNECFERGPKIARATSKKCQRWAYLTNIFKVFRLRAEPNQQVCCLRAFFQ